MKTANFKIRLLIIAIAIVVGMLFYSQNILLNPERSEGSHGKLVAMRFFAKFIPLSGLRT